MPLNFNNVKKYRVTKFEDLRITRGMLLRNLTIIFSEIVLGFQHDLEREDPAGGSRHENAARSGEAHYVDVCVRTSYTRCNRADETDARNDALHGSSYW